MSNVHTMYPRGHTRCGLLGSPHQTEDNAGGDYPPYPLLIHSNNFFYRFKPDDARNVSSVKKVQAQTKIQWILWNAFSLWIFELDKLFWNLISVDGSVNG